MWSIRISITQSEFLKQHRVCSVFFSNPQHRIFLYQSCLWENCIRKMPVILIRRVEIIIEKRKNTLTQKGWFNSKSDEKWCGAILQLWIEDRVRSLCQHMCFKCVLVTEWNMQPETQLDLHRFLSAATARHREQSCYIPVFPSTCFKKNCVDFIFSQKVQPHWWITFANKDRMKYWRSLIP